MKHQAHQAAAAAVFPERSLNVLLYLLVSLFKRGVERDYDDPFFVRRQIVRNVFERNEDRRTHQELAKQERGRPRPLGKSDVALGGGRTGVVRKRYLLDRLEDSVGRLEVALSLTSRFKASFRHLPGLHPKQDVEEVSGVAAHHGPSVADQLLGATGEDGEVVPLGGVVGKLVELVGEGVVEKLLHVAANELQWRHALNLRSVRLPERGVVLRAAVWPRDNLEVLDVVEVAPAQVTAIRIGDRAAGVRVGDAVSCLSGLRFDIGSLPVIAELAG